MNPEASCKGRYQHHCHATRTGSRIQEAEHLTDDPEHVLKVLVDV